MGTQSVNSKARLLMEPVLGAGKTEEVIRRVNALEKLADDGELMAFEHQGFWQPMDTIREKQILEALWDSGRAPWTFPS